jgi:ribosome biogenesis SPOUT family RNA methylase Rps3
MDLFIGGRLAGAGAGHVRMQKLPARTKGRKVPSVRLVIENLEPKHSAWLMLEYAHACKLWGGEVTFSNVKDPKLQRALQGLDGAHVSARGVRDLDVGEAVVLDPKAGKPLTTADCAAFDTLVVGGILGGEVMRGRTADLLTRRVKLPARHLGAIQLPIDIAVFAARAIALGGKLEDLEFTTRLTVRHADGMDIELPYGYPVSGDKVIVTPGLVDYLAENWGEEE